MIPIILAIVLMFIPGYLLTRLIFQTKLFSTLSISIGVSLGISIFSGLILNYIEITKLNLIIFYSLLTVFLLLFSILKRIKLFPESEFNKKEIIILFIVLIISSVIVSIPRQDYSFPNHMDEWNHLEYASKIIQTKHLFQSPYGDYKEKNIETATHIFLAETFLLSSSDPITSYKYFPIIFMFLTCLILFTTVHSISKNNLISIFSVLFYISLKSNANILGTWLFTPFSMSFPLIFLLIYLINLWNEHKTNNILILSILILLITTTIHPSTGIMLFVLYTINFFKNSEWIKNNNKKSLIILLSLIILGILFSKYTVNQKIIQDILFSTENSFRYNYITIYGGIASLFAIIGLFIGLKDKSTKNYVILWLIMFTYYIISYIFSYTAYIEYLRIIYLLMLSSVVLSAIGVDYITKLISNKESIKLIIAGLLIILLIPLQFNHYYSFDPKDTRELRITLHRFIDDNDYQDLNWFNKNNVTNKQIFSLPRIGNVIPITKNYPSARLRLMHGFPKEVTDSNKFFNAKTTCDERKSIIKKYNPKYVFSKVPINCDFLNQIYKGHDFIYSTAK